jgi:octaprenyl-diphosphate synthase
VDDLLDYEGSTSELGKNVGDDLREGKPTFPLLLAMARSNENEKNLIRQAITQGETTRLPEILEIIRQTGALDATREAARAEIDKARLSLEILAPSVHKQTLLDICARAVDRSH